jgi:hypothetical protein
MTEVSNNFRKLPVEHQFKKGNPEIRSGGREKKHRRRRSAESPDRLNTMALDEAIRPVTVREHEPLWPHWMRVPSGARDLWSDGSLSALLLARISDCPRG